MSYNGQLACWGYNNDGEASPLPGSFTQVSAGGYHTCGLKVDGTVGCWGFNSYGQATAPGGTFTQVSAGFYHTCGLKSDSSVTCWGINDHGQAALPVGTFKQLSGGFSHTCGLKSDGTLACWGAGTTNTGTLPEYGQSIPPPGTFTQVSAGKYHTCGISSNGALTCWGLNTYGQSLPISISGSTGVTGVTLSYHDGFNKVATSTSGGSYSFNVSYGWSGTVTPSLTAYTFNPDHRDYSNVVSNQSAQDYAALIIHRIYLPLVIH